MTLLMMLLACGDKEPVDSQGEEPTSTGLVLELQPAELDFGAQSLGEPQDQTIALINRGDSNILLADFSASNPDLNVAAPDAFTIAPNGTENLVVTWTPSESGDMSELLTLSVGEGPSSLEDVMVPLHGQAEGALLVVSESSVDLGTVAVGCADQARVTLTNDGSEPLALVGVELGADDGFTIEGVGFDLEAPPWTVAAGEGLVLEIAYAPTQRQTATGEVLLRVEDNPNPTRIGLEANGVIEQDSTLDFDVGAGQNVTVMMHINESAISGQFSSRFIDSLPTFFETLQDANVDYRAAAVLTDDGVVYGSTPYVDESFTPADSTTAIMAMLADSSQYGDHDANFRTLQNAITANRSWLLDESPAWEDSKLNLMAVNNDQEQSGIDYNLFLSNVRVHKSDSADLMVHGIGGEPPRGCAQSQPMEAFYDAALATGGTFLDICAGDWTLHMETLATFALGERSTFDLTGEPLVSSIEVAVNSVPQLQHWSYNASENSIEFDEDHQPQSGTQVRVYYVHEPECPE